MHFYLHSSCPTIIRICIGINSRTISSRTFAACSASSENESNDTEAMAEMAARRVYQDDRLVIWGDWLAICGDWLVIWGEWLMISEISLCKICREYGYQGPMVNAWGTPPKKKKGTVKQVETAVQGKNDVEYDEEFVFHEKARLDRERDIEGNLEDTCKVKRKAREGSITDQPKNPQSKNPRYTERPAARTSVEAPSHQCIIRVSFLVTPLGRLLSTGGRFSHRVTKLSLKTCRPHLGSFQQVKVSWLLQVLRLVISLQCVHPTHLLMISDVPRLAAVTRSRVN
ncbi:uncharacterized protein EDB91DRAFT_1082376 [Suillus paluster]|uniref:uncharacterized protein n=1 Tax=Suillus paluster TaxID=48578 RepID=UPI001B874FEF|nr:uncharacterized protein EDB91DRAFT_1082376 [Suillus paluster]KAG1739434.1 hypothetical protein EDB91DRAFT_1082376 [Suillus paluster]